MAGTKVTSDKSLRSMEGRRVNRRDNTNLPGTRVSNNLGFIATFNDGHCNSNSSKRVSELSAAG